MSPNPQFPVWNRLLDESVQAMRQQRYSHTAALLHMIVGNGSRKARLWPHYRQALAAYAFALYRNGDIGQALVYQTQLLLLLPNDPEARGNFLLLLKAGVGRLPDSAEFRRVLHSVFARSDVGEYAVEIARSLLQDAVFSQAVELLLSAADTQIMRALRQGRLRALMQAPLFLQLLRGSLIPLPTFETALRRLRKALLLTYAAPGPAAESTRPGKLEWEFIGALAHYSWLTEYASAEDEQERTVVGLLRQQLEAGLSLPSEPSWQPALAYYAMYRSGLELSDCRAVFTQASVIWKPYLQPLIRDWRACLAERVLAAEIDSLTAIGGNISELVRRQYEENPFPRWQQDPVAHQRLTARRWLASFAHDLQLPIEFDGQVDVLTAGCGTGLEPISLVRQIQTGRYLALDLSRASLAYAKRMATQLGLADAIDFKQADITQLADFSEQFDLITASGVLHHLQNPLEGWRILTGLLKPGGIMLVSLYSEAARQTVVRARTLIAEHGWEATPERMRQFRQAILAGEYEALKPLLQWRDFYNLSMFRDLVFHVNEHRYSLPKIEQQLAELGLCFVSMRGLPMPLQAMYQAGFPQDSHGASLANWARFEEQHPNAFAAMYGLVLQKPGRE
ncbi:class I SAM-dependent methyltransferase [Methylomonas albis]|uniref:Class I SAM-dependent methyltransferase n=1 Tax=Methylomonas albis TaxID=1854563 RepID=A0ABR9CXP9_9GAMM|nr:class I SAM-dependent methyltransferase [Methylomonas albis]MBD9355281.1 class I SAM-dependent methyltransferase [Methylomonas albis]